MADFRALYAELTQQLDDALDFTVSSKTHRYMKALVARARAALAQSAPEELTDEEWDALVERTWDKYQTVGYNGERFMVDSDFYNALDYVRKELARWGRPALQPAEALAARPLLEQVARMGDCIGANTVGEIIMISDRAKAWLEANPPGQPVAIEPRGCPAPGACGCVEPAPQP